MEQFKYYFEVLKKLPDTHKSKPSIHTTRFSLMGSNKFYHVFKSFLNFRRRKEDADTTWELNLYQYYPATGTKDILVKSTWEAFPYSIREKRNPPLLRLCERETLEYFDSIASWDYSVFFTNSTHFFERQTVDFTDENTEYFESKALPPLSFRNMANYSDGELVLIPATKATFFDRIIPSYSSYSKEVVDKETIEYIDGEGNKRGYTEEYKRKIKWKTLVLPPGNMPEYNTYDHRNIRGGKLLSTEEYLGGVKEKVLDENFLLVVKSVGKQIIHQVKISKVAYWRLLKEGKEESIFEDLPLEQGGVYEYKGGVREKEYSSKWIDEKGMGKLIPRSK